ncbi:hypothetical protein TraAM80_04724 [Trypanosoma rangeli]|uniref:Uncharacterized protein n=1 Tax=Trypanosoma rangeli TaxID=5698 RepID=A0A3R7MFV6_TRYRA|nr:uncharacterized protein TraAM80_04724 [Trypanosoma rangeli]RNF05078.1 hypothetical protein TraAM80_04724 [Trypanosoma rangeli]|eukprot:RNF05078.1 hypothetical protein TraAM80_04724 [Trypanosoma rangeli]
MKRACVNILLHFPDTIDLVVSHQLLLTSEAVTALKGNNVGEALVDFCHSEDVGLTVTVKHDPEGMRNKLFLCVIILIVVSSVACAVLLLVWRRVEDCSVCPTTVGACGYLCAGASFTRPGCLCSAAAWYQGPCG